jgi:hypothetical protein
MKETDSAFPVMDTVMRDGGKELESIAPGMTLRQYAAIHLKVPRSGDAEIDAMIRESLRAEFAKQAMMGIAAKVYNVGEYKPPHVWGDIADEARIMADAMLAELDKEAGK